MRNARNYKSSSKRGIIITLFCIFASIVAFFIYAFISKKRGKPLFGSLSSIGSESGTTPQGSISDSLVSQEENMVVTYDDTIHGLNNPGNVLYYSSNDWKGQTGYNLRNIGGKFYKYINFDSMHNGIRCLFYLLNKHLNRIVGTSSDSFKSMDSNVLNKIYASYSRNANDLGFADKVKEMFESDSQLSMLNALAGATYLIEKGSKYNKDILNAILQFKFED